MSKSEDISMELTEEEQAWLDEQIEQATKEKMLEVDMEDLYVDAADDGFEPVNGIEMLSEEELRGFEKFVAEQETA
eukprot:CAMPEP_0198724910 /NCGR_PEP_ID=MMETSP1475-20131203/2306_1 /TAXON_ID= ORGANISM="Unidentified sp., Strain CCMP1999" /NCGR_SAMPLE_ID=MMETSP1475 /ASSEMBLY_ACC=CAM_ASM_001111 /LENGTH=75 /DNA_ID=CAMNT_0044486549 /DNA_START=108 /DNA_END=335 /DNA_ORIENTATION=+